MLVLPAIDILDGKAVRLYKGDYNQVTTYNQDPLEVAKEFKALGIERIHLVDLDAAKGKGQTNRPIIAKIVSQTGLKVELGGGIRTLDDVKELLDFGIAYLIIGTALVKNPIEVETWVRLRPEAFVAGIDAYDGDVKVSGWLDGSGIKDTELGLSAKKMGFGSIIYTNIAKDGTLQGPDFERTLNMAKVTGLDVILSGGISSIDDIKKLAEYKNQGIIGFISGKAMYEKKFDLKEAIEICKL